MADELFDYLDQDVASSDYEAVSTTLQTKLPLEQLEDEFYHSLLNHLLRVASSVSDWRMAKLVYEIFEEANEQQQTFPLFAEMFTLYDVSQPADESERSDVPEPGPYTDELLEIMIRHVLRGEYSAFELLSSLVEQDPTPGVLLAARRVIDLFSSIEEGVARERYAALFKKARQAENVPMATFFSDRLQEVSLYAPKPGYSLAAPDHSVPYEDEVPLPEPIPLGKIMEIDLERAVEVLTDGLRQDGVDLDQVDRSKEALRAQLQLSNAAEREALLGPALKSLGVELSIEAARPEKLDEIFRVVGPINALYGSDLADRENICCRYGGCTMFYCQQFEIADEDDLDVEGDVDWFRGACDYCDLRIEERWHACRRPLIHGGWKGCFCSWRCVRLFVDDAEPDLAVTSMIARVSAQLDVVGVLDRRTRGETTKQIEYISDEERERLYASLANELDEADEEAGVSTAEHELEVDEALGSRPAELVDEEEDWPEPSKEEGWQE